MKLKKMVKVLAARFADVAFPFRMGAGFPGDVNRTHPVEIEATLLATVNPVAFYGFPGIMMVTGGVQPNAIRGFTVGDDGVVDAWGFAVRPFPIQQGTGGMTSNFGASAIPVSPPVADFMRSGLMMVSIPAGQNPSKGDPVFVWCAASVGLHVQGGCEAVAGGGANTAALSATKYTFNGPADANGNVEIAVRI